MGALEGLQRIGVEGIKERGEMDRAWEHHRIPDGALRECRRSWASARERTKD